MVVRAYVSIQGISFNPTQFQAKAGGEARRRKHSGAPLANVPLEYWVSAERIGDMKTAISGLIAICDQLAEHSSLLPRGEDVGLIGHLVVEYSNDEELAGSYFPPALVSRLASLGGALDIDAVRRST